MALIAQRELFAWKEIENLGDLERLKPVLEYLPDEALMQRLELSPRKPGIHPALTASNPHSGVQSCDGTAEDR